MAGGIAGLLLAGSLVVGIAPVAADGNGVDVPEGHMQNQQEDRDVAPDTHLSITSVTIEPAVSFSGVAAPLNDGARFVEDLNDKT